MEFDLKYMETELFILVNDGFVVDGEDHKEISSGSILRVLMAVGRHILRVGCRSKLSDILPVPSDVYDITRYAEMYTMPGTPCLVKSRRVIPNSDVCLPDIRWCGQTLCDIYGWLPRMESYPFDVVPYDSRCAILDLDGWTDIKDPRRRGVVPSSTIYRPVCRLTFFIASGSADACKMSYAVARRVACSSRRLYVFASHVDRFRDCLLTVAMIITQYEQGQGSVEFHIGIPARMLLDGLDPDKSLEWLCKRLRNGSVRVYCSDQDVERMIECNIR